jgi:hypothetical protein
VAVTSAQIPVIVAGLQKLLDVDANLFGMGTVAARPATGDVEGDLYFVNDDPLYALDIWDGSIWVRMTIIGPTSAVDHAIARWDGTTGAILQNSVVVIDDAGNITGVGTINGTTPGEATIYPGGISDIDLWFDASDPSTLWTDSTRTTQVTSDGDTVEAWDDKSGNARHATNATGTATWGVSEFGGRPAIVFPNSTSQSLTTPAFSHGTTNGLTMFAVYRNDQASGTDYLCVRGGSIRVPWAVDAGTGIGPGFYDGTHRAFAAEVVSGPSVFSVIYEAGGTARMRRRDVEIGTGTAYTAFADASATHALGGGASAMNGVLCEYILINREIDETERAAVLNYLEQKWLAVDGPNTSVDNSVATFNGTSGAWLQGSPVEIDDAGNVDNVLLLNGRPIIPSPANLTDIELWFDAADLSTLWQDSGRTTKVTASGDTVEAWDDKSGNNRHAVNASSTLTWDADGFNGLPAVDFPNAAEGDLTTPSFTHGTTGGMSMFAVYRNDATGQADYLVQMGTGGTIKVPWASDAGTGTGPGFYDGAHKAFTTVEVTDENVFSVIYESAGSTARMYRRSTEIGSGVTYTAFADASTFQTIGGELNKFDGVLCEYILVNREVTADERALIITYLVDKWFNAPLHSDVASEISALTLVSVAPTDHILIEDASDSNNKKRIAASDLQGLDAPSPAINGDVMARWDASASNKIQETGIGVSDLDQMTGIVTASLVEYLVPYVATTTPIDWNDGATQWLTLKGNVSLTFTAPPAGTRVMLKLIQDNVGSRTVKWPSTVRWIGGAAPALGPTAGYVDFITFYYDGATYWGSAAGATAWDLARELSDTYAGQLLWDFSNAYVVAGAGFPRVDEVTVTNSAFGTSHDLNFPSTVNTGDLLLLVVNWGLADTTYSSRTSGWTELDAPLDSSNVTTVASYLKRADGTETAFNYTLSSSSLLQAQIYRFTAGTWNDTGTLSDAYTAGTPFVDAGDSTPDPPICNPGSALDYLFVTWFGADNEPTVSAIPTSYTNEVTTRGGGGGSTATTLGSARRELNATSDTPSNFNISAAEESVSQTICIHPPTDVVFDRSDNGNNGLSTGGPFWTGSGLLPNNVNHAQVDAGAYHINVAALSEDVAVAHSVIALFDFTAAATFWDIDATYDAEMLITTATLTFNDGTARDTGRAEASLENQPVLLGYSRTSTTNIDLYENGLKWRSLTTGTFSTQTTPEVSFGATNTGTNTSTGDMGLFGIFGQELTEAEHYDIWLKLTGQKHFWHEFVVPNGLNTDCEQYLVLWEQAGTQLLDVSGNEVHGTADASLTLGVAAMDDYHAYCVEWTGASAAYITSNLTAIDVVDTAWTIAGVCTSDADGDGIFAIGGGAGNMLGMRSVATGNLEVFLDDDGGADDTQSMTKPSGAFAWCFRRSGTDIDWWVNGIKQTTLDITGHTLTTGTTLRYMSLNSGFALDGKFTHRGTYSAAFTDEICELLGDLELIDRTPVV